MKKCTICGDQKPLSEFYKDNARKDKHQSKCKPCHEKAKVKSRLGAYGLTKETYSELFKNQNGCCAICQIAFENTKHTHIDHCHTTNKVRALLCHGCNTAIGLFKESPEILKSAVKYLKKYNLKLQEK
jgi:YesN/AraC family two-component response regulator